MLTALIIANIALTIGAMYMVKETKMNKKIEDLDFNIALIQNTGIEISNNITSSEKEIIEEFNTVNKKAIDYPSQLVFLKSK